MKGQCEGLSVCISGSAAQRGLLQTRIAERLVEGLFVWQFELFTGPCPQVHTFAARAAKGPVGVGTAVKTVARTRGATHLTRRKVGRLTLLTHAHKDISNGTSSVVANNLPSACCRIMRITTNKRLQLISGVMPNAGSIFKRSS